MGASPRQVILHVIAPGALPEIFVGLRIGMGVGWTTLVAAEMVAADAGLGKMVFNAANFCAPTSSCSARSSSASSPSPSRC